MKTSFEDCPGLEARELLRNVGSAISHSNEAAAVEIE
jgi:hypothetical protein